VFLHLENTQTVIPHMNEPKSLTSRVSVVTPQQRGAFHYKQSFKIWERNYFWWKKMEEDVGECLLQPLSPNSLYFFTKLDSPYGSWPVVSLEFRQPQCFKCSWTSQHMKAHSASMSRWARVSENPLSKLVCIKRKKRQRPRWAGWLCVGCIDLWLILF